MDFENIFANIFIGFITLCIIVFLVSIWKITLIVLAACPFLYLLGKLVQKIGDKIDGGYGGF